MFKSSNKEHEVKTHQSNKYTENGNIESVKVKIRKENGKMFRHTIQCAKDINLKRTFTVKCTETEFKAREGVK